MEHIPEVNFLGNHPVVGWAISIVFLFVGIAVKQIEETHIPLIVMQFFQIIAWSATIIVGFITTYGWVKKNFKKRKHGKN